MLCHPFADPLIPFELHHWVETSWKAGILLCVDLDSAGIGAGESFLGGPVQKML